MSKRRVTAVIASAAAVVFVAGAAWAQHTSPPTYIDVPGATFSIGVESTNGQYYHDDAAAGRSGSTCSTAPADDGAGDDGFECYNSADQLRGKNVGAAEGGAANCQAVPGLNAGGQVIFDGVWVDGPTSGDCVTTDTRGRIYTGVGVAGAGNGGLAAGGDATSRGGCVQAFGEDDTPGNLIKTTTDALQSAGGSAHSGTDDDTDLTICGDAA